MNKTLLLSVLILGFFFSCKEAKKSTDESVGESPATSPLAMDVVRETQRSWNAYVTYAWGHDELKPISKSYFDWYDKSLSISPIDAYSTLKMMGLEDETERIEKFVTDSLDFNKDVFVKTFELNIRVLGGLLSIYHLTENDQILDKARDFGDRLLKAFNSKTGLPHYWVNLKTGDVKGDTINVAEAGSCLFEMAILSYYTADPKYYQAAKSASMTVHNMRSELNLLGRDLDIESGEWTLTTTMVGAYVDSYFEYLYKTWLLMGDPDLKKVWDESFPALHTYVAEASDTTLWYGRVDMYTGEKVNSTITLWDAYFPALLALSGDMDRAEKTQKTWDWLWNKYGLVPTVYNYADDAIVNPFYQLNPEVIESGYYLWHYTGDSTYYRMVKQYYSDLKQYCRTDIAYSHVSDVVSMEKKDEMATFFFAETLKYFYLAFSNNPEYGLDHCVYSTEAHPFRKEAFDKEVAKKNLGY